MLIQSVNNLAQAVTPAKPANEGGFVAAVSTASTAQAQPSVRMELPDQAVNSAAEKKPSANQVQNVLDSINRALKQSNKNLEFSLDPDTNKSVVKLIDSETGDVIRQFPSEEALAISKAIDRLQQGILLKQEA